MSVLDTIGSILQVLYPIVAAFCFGAYLSALFLRPDLFEDDDEWVVPIAHGQYRVEDYLDGKDFDDAA